MQAQRRLVRVDALRLLMTPAGPQRPQGELVLVGSGESREPEDASSLPDPLTCPDVVTMVGRRIAARARLLPREEAALALS